MFGCRYTLVSKKVLFCTNVLIACFPTWFNCLIQTWVWLIPPFPARLCSHGVFWFWNIICLHHQSGSRCSLMTVQERTVKWMDIVTCFSLLYFGFCFQSANREWLMCLLLMNVLQRLKRIWESVSAEGKRKWDRNSVMLIRKMIEKMHKNCLTNIYVIQFTSKTKHRSLHEPYPKSPFLGGLEYDLWMRIWAEKTAFTLS